MQGKRIAITVDRSMGTLEVKTTSVHGVNMGGVMGEYCAPRPLAAD